MAEPRTEWGKELKAQTASMLHEFAELQQQVTSLTSSLRDCNSAVGETMAALAELRKFKDDVSTRLDHIDHKVDASARFQESTRVQLAWIKWLLGVGATAIIAIGIFIASSLLQLSTATAKLESTLQHIQSQPKR